MSPVLQWMLVKQKEMIKVIADEICVPYYDPEFKIPGMQLEMLCSPIRIKPRTHTFVRALIYDYFWDVIGVLMKDKLPIGNTIKGRYYLLTKLE